MNKYPLKPLDPSQTAKNANLYEKRIAKNRPPMGKEPQPVSHPPRIVRDPLMKGSKK